MAVTVSVLEAKTHLSELLKRVETGEEIVIARHGRPVAQLSAIGRPDFVYGGFSGLVVGEEFFEPLGDEELTAWEDGPVEPAT